MNLIKAIKNFKEKNKRVLFTTPGHSQGNLIPDVVKELLGVNIFRSDLSEIEGLDNIRVPEGIFLESQKRTAEIYKSKASFYLFNGSSSGIIALMLTIAKPNEKVLIARNSHISVYNALVLSGINPVWLNTGFIEDFNISKPVTANDIKKHLEESPDIASVWITSPTYEGVCSDIKAISEVCKERKVALIVDEAHGALWNFNPNLPTPAIFNGADAVVQSLHKTACALTQGAILHISKDSLINPEEVQQSLNIINSTSPSYPILASIEGCVEYLNSEKGQNKLRDYLLDIENFRKEILKHRNILILSDTDDFNLDQTKLFIKVKGLSGYELSDLLISKYNIEDEFCNDLGALFITGIGTLKSDLEKLKKALWEIADNASKREMKSVFEVPFSRVLLSPRDAFYSKKEKIKVSNSVGEISGELIIPYPPGIPVLMPGELIKTQHLKYLQDKDEILIIKHSC